MTEVSVPFRFQCGKKPLVMGILNVTPDSFSDGGKYLCAEAAVRRALEMERQGADIIDVGAQSTRPGHTVISAEEESARLDPVLPALRKAISVPLSVDTFYPQVAAAALDHGACIINDVKGFADSGMFRLVKQYNCCCVIMHPGGAAPPFFSNIRAFFEERLSRAAEFGILPDQICFDPGVGFGKTLEQNLALLGHVEQHRVPGCSMLIGASRKRVIGACCGDPPFEDRLAGTVAAHSIAVFAGADIIRVHDVPQAVQAARVAYAIRRGQVG